MAKTTYVWDELSDNVIEEYEDGVLSVSYDHEPGLYGNLLSQNRNGVTSYYHYDGRGDTVALTDDSGNVTDTKEYDAWGNVIASTGSTVTPFQFAGKNGYQTEVGVVSVRENVYQPIIGRWLNNGSQARFNPSQRPLDEISLPIKRIAPFPVTCNGEFWWKYSRGNDDSFAQRPFDGNFQSAVLCVELDVASNCRMIYGKDPSEFPDHIRDRCCIGDISYSLKYRAIQTGHVYPALSMVPGIPGTSLAFHREHFTAYVNSESLYLNDNSCFPSGAPLQLTVMNPMQPGSNLPWGQGSSLAVAFECTAKCRSLNNGFRIDIHRDADAGIFSKGSRLQSVLFGGSRTKCWDRRPRVYANVQHYQNSPIHRSADMVRLIAVSPSVGFVGPLQLPHDPQPVWPQS